MNAKNDGGDGGFAGDAHLEAQLDRALAPQAGPEDLVQRIMLHTRQLLPGHRGGVLARIGPWATFVRAAAASIILAAWLGVWVAGGTIVRDGRELAQLQTGVIETNEMLAIRDERVAEFAVVDAFDKELDQLSDHINDVLAKLEEQARGEMVEPLF